jgi:hypothetical protein
VVAKALDQEAASAADQAPATNIVILGMTMVVPGLAIMIMDPGWQLVDLVPAQGVTRARAVENVEDPVQGPAVNMSPTTHGMEKVARVQVLEDARAPEAEAVNAALAVANAVAQDQGITITIHG